MIFMNLAHRGASEYAPENTLAAFYKGIEMGANGIETDLRRTKDGKIILFHDQELDRTTNGSGKPGDYTWEELQQLDAGSWLSPEYKGERLVSFEEFLHHFGRKDLYFAIELKDPFIEKESLVFIYKYGVEQKATVTSFYYENLVRVREQDSNVKIGYLIKKIDQQNLDRLLAIGGTQICPSVEYLTKEDVQTAKEHGLEVRSWGTFNTDLMHHALACGVDGMTINFPDRLTEALNNKQSLDSL